MAVMAVAPPVIGVATRWSKLTLATAGLLEYQLCRRDCHLADGSGLVCQIYCRARPGCSDGDEIDIGACAGLSERLVRPEQWPARPAVRRRGAGAGHRKVAVCVTTVLSGFVAMAVITVVPGPVAVARPPFAVIVATCGLLEAQATVVVRSRVPEWRRSPQMCRWR